MMDYPSLSAEDKKWQAEHDARTMAEAEAIKADPERFKAAAEAAEGIKKEAMDEAMALEKISRGFQYAKEG